MSFTETWFVDSRAEGRKEGRPCEAKFHRWERQLEPHGVGSFLKPFSPSMGVIALIYDLRVNVYFKSWLPVLW